MNANQTHLLGLRLNDMSGNDVLLAMEFIRFHNLDNEKLWVKTNGERANEIGKYLLLKADAIDECQVQGGNR